MALEDLSSIPIISIFQSADIEQKGKNRKHDIKKLFDFSTLRLENDLSSADLGNNFLSDLSSSVGKTLSKLFACQGY